MPTEAKQQPTAIKNRNKASAVSSVGNKEDSRINLDQTIENLRHSSPILADQIDAMVAYFPNANPDQNKYWLFLHSQLSYTVKFEQSRKDKDYFAPPRPPSALTISSIDLQKIAKDSSKFIKDNFDDIERQLEGSGMGRPKPTGR